MDSREAIQKAVEALNLYRIAFEPGAKIYAKHGEKIAVGRDDVRRAAHRYDELTSIIAALGNLSTLIREWAAYQTWYQSGVSKEATFIDWYAKRMDLEAQLLRAGGVDTPPAKACVCAASVVE